MLCREEPTEPDRNVASLSPARSHVEGTIMPVVADVVAGLVPGLGSVSKQRE